MMQEVPTYRPENEYEKEIDVATAQRFLSAYQKRLAILEGDYDIEMKAMHVTRNKWPESASVKMMSDCIEKEKEHIRQRIEQCERALGAVAA